MSIVMMITAAARADHPTVSFVFFRLLALAFLVPFREAEILIGRWRDHYNTFRPHSSLGYQPPAPEAMLPLDRRTLT
jgi:transposase InsO family protein